MFGESWGGATRGLAALLVLMPLTLIGPLSAFAQDRAVSDVTGTIPPVAQAAAAKPFGLDAIPVTSGEITRKWRRVIDEIRAESEILARCRDDAEDCPAAAQKFLAVIAEGRAHDGRARYGLINRAINLAIQPVSDLTQWGVSDRWSAPLATLTTGRGDCEDYAIAKYVALREAGVAEDDLRLLIVRDFASGQDHAVVTARIEEKWLVLDNRRFVLVEDSDMPHVVPLFALGHDGVKQFAPVIARISDGVPAALKF
jgi:predicted transglutaminase-like cysteine proteinase